MLKNLLYFAIFSTFLVVVVIGLNIYHNFTTSTVSGDATIQVIPITPSFNMNTIQMLKRRTIIQADLNESIVFPTTPASLPKSIQNVTPTPIEFLPEEPVEAEATVTPIITEAQESPTPTTSFFPVGL